ncbi:MAG: metallophosphoesterase [Acutalibacteraceae bacterium]
MIYVMSDIHGMYDKYKMMLEKLNLETEDALFVLGDIIDKGSDGIKILADMRYRANIYPVLGEHEYLAKKLLALFEDADSKEECESLLNDETKSLYDFWLISGGEPTLDGFLNLLGEDRESIIDYLGEFEAYEQVEAAGRSYVLVHAGINGFDAQKSLDDYSEQDFVSKPSDLSKVYFKNSFLVSGHVPTQNLSKDGEARVISKNHQLKIDCGAYEGGKLAAVCLDTLKVYYV